MITTLGIFAGFVLGFALAQFTLHKEVRWWIDAHNKVCEEYGQLHYAVEQLYYAGVWRLSDDMVKTEDLKGSHYWTAVRDAAGFQVGGTSGQA